MYKKMILEDIRNATSSPVSAGGASRCNSQDGRKIDPYGQEAALASHTAQQGNNSGITMRETYGQHSSVSYQSATLNLYLANRLKTRFATGGSIEYTQTWKEKVTPSGRPYLAHTASGRRIADTGSTWEVFPFHTPRASDGTNGVPGQGGGALYPDAALTAWPTPTSRDHKDGSPSNVPINLLGRVVWQVFLPGETANSSSAGMKRLAGYRLNPYFSGWLMGFPKEWTKAGLRAFRKLKASRSQKKRKDE